MTKKKSTKRALISSLLILAMCFTMLAGTTFAWFTDSVTSGSNIIKSGKLDVDLLVKGGNIDTKDTNLVAETDGYYSLDKNTGLAVFNYDLWEPGYTVVANAKVVNKGNLALKYTLKIAATGTASELADVIDVYYAPSVVAVADRDLANNTNLRKLGTLAEVLAGGANVTINDTLIPGTNEEDFATIALQMQTTAGNEYQEKSIGSGFTLQLLATQYTKEADSFNDQYDAGATYPPIVITTVEELQTAISDLGDGSEAKIELGGDVQLNNLTTPVLSLEGNKEVVIDLKGKEFDLGTNSGNTIEVKNGAKLTLTDSTGGGELAMEVPSMRNAVVVTNAELDVANIDVSVTGSYSPIAVYANEGATVNIKDGAKISANAGDAWAVYAKKGATVNIKDGAEISVDGAGGIGVYVLADSTCNMTGGVINCKDSNNGMRNHWGVYVGGNNAQFNMSDGVINVDGDNTAIGIYADSSWSGASIAMTGGVINVTAKGDGASFPAYGISSYGVPVTMSGGTINVDSTGNAVAIYGSSNCHVTVNGTAAINVNKTKSTGNIAFDCNTSNLVLNITVNEY